MFLDRQDAGKKLGTEIIKKYPNISEGIVLALPRGGVVVGFEISKKLGFPLDIIATRKIGSPLNPEYAIAAVGEHTLVLNQREKIDKIYLEEHIKKERLEIARRLKEYRGNRPYPDLKNNIVFIVDDGLATGLSMKAAIAEVKKSNPKKIIVAIPVAPPDCFSELKNLVDEIIVLEIEPMFFAVGQFYQNFPQTSDQEVKNILKDSW